MPRYTTITSVNNAIPSNSSLKAIRFAGFRKYKDGRRALVLCECKCGNLFVGLLKTILKGNCKSCGCLKFLPYARKHGMSYTHPLYQIWGTIKNRCKNNSRKHYRYAGRGIKVCKEWQNSFQSFFNWAIANGWKKGLELDRRKNNGNYSPSNCRFVTRRVNMNNREISIYIKLGKVRKPLMDWSRELKIPAPTLYARVNRKLPPAEILSTKYTKRSK